MLLSYQPAIVGFHSNIASVLSTGHRVDQHTSLVLNFVMDENGLVTLHECFVEPDGPKPAPANLRVRVKPTT